MPKKSKKYFLLAITFILIINLSLRYSYLIDPVHRKPCIDISDIKQDFQDDKSKYEYVGVEKCAAVCHNSEKMGFQYDIWKTSLHSNAFKNLFSKRAEIYARKAHIKGNPQESLACLSCHTSAGVLDSTYLTPTYRKEEGVTCEACHKYKFVAKAYLPKEASCLKCHNDSLHKIPKFDFKKNCLIIAHPRTTDLTQNNHSTEQPQ